MDELLDDPASLRILRLLLNGPMNMKTFTYESRKSPKHAKTLRENMERLGLLVVDEAARATFDIRLTREGEQIAKLLLEVDPILETAKRKAGARKIEK
jgi:hypothetical protein